MIQMPNDRNRNSVLRQLAALQKMSLCDLKDKWKDLYGTEPPTFRKSFIQKRLAYRIQELFYGGLSVDVQEKLQGKSKAKKTSNKRELVLPGTRFIREWGGDRHEVIAREKGFEYKGKMFRSLSAIASEITGSHWNGKRFFGLSAPVGTGRQVNASNSASE
jgi:hypothetical protein